MQWDQRLGRLQWSGKMRAYHLPKEQAIVPRLRRIGMDAALLLWGRENNRVEEFDGRHSPKQALRIPK